MQANKQRKLALGMRIFSNKVTTSISLFSPGFLQSSSPICTRMVSVSLLLSHSPNTSSQQPLDTGPIAQPTCSDSLHTSHFQDYAHSPRTASTVVRKSGHWKTTFFLVPRIRSLLTWEKICIEYSVVSRMPGVQFSPMLSIRVFLTPQS